MEKTKWYALRVISGKERKTKEFLEKLVEQTDSIKNLVSNIVLPMEKIYKIRSGKKYATDKNFFPGYLLVEALIDGEVQHVIEGAPNVMHFLKDGKKATPLKPHEVERILGRIDEIKGQTEFDIPYIIGENVQIIQGPFSSFNGLITSVDAEKQRAKLMVKIFGRETPLELAFDHIGKV